MNEQIEWSRKHVLRGTHWQVDEDTFRVLDERQGAWIARVTTTHLQSRGEPESSFYVLVSLARYITLDDTAFAALGAYIQERENKQ